jgi:hypothetical protein
LYKGGTFESVLIFSGYLIIAETCFCQGVLTGASALQRWVENPMVIFFDAFDIDPCVGLKLEKRERKC